MTNFPEGREKEEEAEEEEDVIPDDAVRPQVTQRVMRPIHPRSSALRCHVGVAGRTR